MIIFSTKRTLKAYIGQIAKNGGGFLPKMMLFDLAIKKLINVPNKQRANAYESLICMHQAIKSVKNFNKLGLSDEFFNFLKNKEYIFSFFKELSFFQKNIKDISTKDIYAFYDEHLSILELVLDAYKKIMNKNGLFDEITLENYEINEIFLKDEEKIIFYLEGNINLFELSFLQKISKFLPVFIRFYVSDFNKNTLERVFDLKQLKFEPKTEYELDLREFLQNQQGFKIIKKLPNTPQIYLKTFNEDYLQAFWVQEKISHLIRLGIDPKKIAVITPDESKTKLLEVLDFKNMLNFASGISIKQTRFYKIFELFLDDLPRINKESFTQKGVIFDNVNEMIIAKYKKLNTQEIVIYDDFADFIKLMLDDNNELIYLIENELESFSVIFDYLNTNLKELMGIFYQSIKSLSLSYVGGGEVGVYGILESRGMSFDGVIVVDFNDDLVPKRSVNELFLSNIVRKNSGLITYEDRENLQRHYYYSLFARAKFVYICAIDDDEKIPSRFLSQLKIVEDNDFLPSDYEKLFDFGKKQINTQNITFGKIKYDFFAYPFSYSRLQLFVQNRQKYYLRYILGTKNPRELSTELNPANMGTLVHNSLEKYYEDKKNYFDKDEFLACFKAICKEKYAANNDFNIYDFVPKMDFEIFKFNLNEFEKRENERFKNGAKIIALEQKFDKKLKNFNCLKDICITGRIDRVDLVDEKPFLIDYKYSKNKPNPSQLAFYMLAYDEEVKTAFYMLKERILLDEQNDEKKLQKELQKLEKYIKDILELGDEIDFDGCFLDEKGQKIQTSNYPDYLDEIINTK